MTITIYIKMLFQTKRTGIYSNKIFLIRFIRAKMLHSKSKVSFRTSVPLQKKEKKSTLST